jgi:hypothetical protein
MNHADIQAELARRFAGIGARIRVRPLPPIEQTRTRFSTWQPASPPARRKLLLDVSRDRQGEYFEVRLDGREVDLEVTDAQPRLRHLLLLARDSTGSKEKYLFGRDERHWFVAGIPDVRGVSNVLTAMEALKPETVRDRQEVTQVRARHRRKRRTAAYVRQGEWFFVPEPQLEPPAECILRHEPLRRGRSKPHVAESLYRRAGETVYVHREFPDGLTQAEYENLIKNEWSAPRVGWSVMRRDPDVFVRGRVRHPDHKTIRLSGWYRVLVNTEPESASLASVVFLD